MEPTTPQRAINEELKKRGIKRQQVQAGVIGESPEQWSRYLNSKRSPQCCKVQDWLETAKKNGHDLLLMWAPSTGVAVVNVPSPADGAPASRSALAPNG